VAFTITDMSVARIHGAIAGTHEIALRIDRFARSQRSEIGTSRGSETMQHSSAVTVEAVMPAHRAHDRRLQHVGKLREAFAELARWSPASSSGPAARLPACSMMPRAAQHLLWSTTSGRPLAD
jgi:hypothetical protein